MRIPIFVSCPTQLNIGQERSRKVIMHLLDQLQMEARALGRTDYPKDYPLKEVYLIARHCSGGLILGFEQYFITSGYKRRDTKEAKQITTKKPILLPSPWNQLEAGILFGLKLPLLIFREDNIEGGVFDIGTTEVFVHPMPPPRPSVQKKEELKQIFLKWQGEVNRHYNSY